MMDVPQDVFVETMRSYNEACEKGYDDAFMKKPQYLRAVDKAPFYAIPLATGTMGSAGGIKINGNMQVVDVDGNAIEGLYAVAWTPRACTATPTTWRFPGARTVSPIPRAASPRATRLRICKSHPTFSFGTLSAKAL